MVKFSIASPFASKLCMAEKNVLREGASVTDTQVAIDVWTTAHDQICMTSERGEGGGDEWVNILSSNAIRADSIH